MKKFFVVSLFLIAFTLRFVGCESNDYRHDYYGSYYNNQYGYYSGNYDDRDTAYSVRVDFQNNAPGQVEVQVDDLPAFLTNPGERGIVINEGMFYGEDKYVTVRTPAYVQTFTVRNKYSYYKITATATRADIYP